MLLIAGMRVRPLGSSTLSIITFYKEDQSSTISKVQLRAILKMESNGTSFSCLAYLPWQPCMPEFDEVAVSI